NRLCRNVQQLTNSFNFFQLRNIPGYSFGIQNTILSGLQPSQHKLWMPYFFSDISNNLKHRILSILPRVKYNPDPFLRMFKTFLLYAFFMGNKRVKLHSIDFSMAKYISTHNFYYMFDSIFFKRLISLLSENVYIKLLGPPKTRNPLNELEALINNGIKRETFCAINIDILDLIAHKYGYDSLIFDKTIQYIDCKISKILSILERKFGSQFHFILFSDHGGSDASHLINLRPILKELSYKYQIKYIIDATMVLIKLSDPSMSDHIKRVLSKDKTVLIFSRFEDIKTLEKNGIYFNDSMYGDIIIQANVKSSFFPNFYSDVRPLKGVHGYWPDEYVQYGWCILNLTKNPFMSSSKEQFMPEMYKALTTLLQ
ncbi:MAG: alkaline phosphatase family protein, partial [Nitrososphaeria archaeon]